MKAFIQILFLLLSLSAAGQPGAAQYWSMHRPLPPVILAPETQRFVDSVAAKGVTLSSTIRNALDRLVRDLQGESNPSYTTYNIWTNGVAFYPFVGGTAAAHSLNLKDPSAFSITWFGSPTHSANGVQHNLSSWGNTGITASTNLQQDSCHMSIYSRTQSHGTYIDIGTYNSNAFYAMYNYGGVSFYTKINGNETSRLAPSWGFFPTTGLLIASRINASTIVYSVTDAYVTTYTGDNSLGMVSYPIFIGGLNNGTGPDFRTNRQYCFASVGSGLDSARQIFLQKAVQAFETALGRQL